MSKRRLRLGTLGFVCAGLLGSALIVCAEEPAKVLSNEEIQRALAPAPAAVTRSFTPRGLARREASQSDQSVNLNIPFEYNSSALKPQASEQLKQLKLALTSSALGSDRFIVAGHTDAKGSAQYNKQLSLKRAEAVKSFLVAKGMDAARLETVGFGSEHLLTPDKPDDASNRRVEIRDLGSGAH
ncbi:MAG TPA: OmpA family protein [Steroidobacteraceae bacterium]|jgi:outer membrane protein OmpA-like peptidoglycan-associated protein